MSRALPKLAYSISEFCELVGVSRNFFYTLSPEARPRMIKRGGRYFITTEAVREWLEMSGAAA
jgi:excisionase family DNA binding protein